MTIHQALETSFRETLEWELFLLRPRELFAKVPPITEILPTIHKYHAEHVAEWLDDKAVAMAEQVYCDENGIGLSEFVVFG